ncbi:hypothetical protein E2386_11595 [Salmonella enterica subsp. enterica serovar Enteritidis]|nr:hypothetical protein [Salmonella enterica subsp. enterica serovar Enteritidis]
MSIVDLTLTEVGDGIEVSMKTSDDRTVVAKLEETVYGNYVVGVSGKVSMYRLAGILSVFDGGLLPSDQLELQNKLIDNDFYTENVKVFGYSMMGGVFSAATNTLNFGTQQLIQFSIEKGKLKTVWKGSAAFTPTDLLLTSAEQHLKASKSGRAFLEQLNR